MGIDSPRLRTPWRCLLLLLALSCAACLAGPYAWDLQTTTPPPQPQPQAGKALVYFYRTLSLYPLTNVPVNDGFDRIGILASGSYFFYQAEPRRHLFWAEVDFRGDLVLDLEAGKTYYIRCDLSMSQSGLPDRPVFTVMSASRGAEELAGQAYVTPR